MVSLDRITVDMGVSAKRALRLEGDVQAILIDSVLTDGQAPLGENGGNVWMSGDATLALIRSTISLGEVNEGSGGGIYCENGGTVLVDGGSVVRENKAGDAGGGIFGQGCTIDIQGWIYLNDTSGDGGGIYATGGASVLLTGTGSDDFSMLESNLAGENSGGLHLTGSGTTAIARNARISATPPACPAEGSACSVGRSSPWTSTPQPARSGTAALRWRCNTAGIVGGGAINVSAGSSATIRQTMIRINEATDGIGSVAVVFGTLLIEGCEIYANDGAALPDGSRFYIAGSATIAFSTIREPVVFADVFFVLSGATFRLYSSIVLAHTDLPRSRIRHRDRLCDHP